MKVQKGDTDKQEAEHLSLLPAWRLPDGVPVLRPAYVLQEPDGFDVSPPPAGFKESGSGSLLKLHQQVGASIFPRI